MIKSASLVSTFALATALAGCAQTNTSQTNAAVESVPAPAKINTRNTDPNNFQEFGRVSFNKDVLMIDGTPTIIWGGEMHPFRLPSPDLWRDIFQKMKSNGYNTVAIYISWGYHSPAPGVYDFTGLRDMDRVLKMAAEEGLYVITRAGPYVNAELSRGGFPGYLVNQRARARTDAPEYVEAVDEWLSQINPIIAENEINNGGSVILHQIENELALTTPAQSRYMDHLYEKARADGITVPIFHNDQGRNGYWVPEESDVPLTVQGPVDMYAFDGYPGGSCDVHGNERRGSAAPDWGFYGVGGAKGGASASPTPGFAAEFGGGWFDYWGSNGGYECNSRQRGLRFQRVFYGTNIANGIDIQSFYMTYGGTSWGWLNAPVIYTSYDYGAAISEEREIRLKMKEMKLLGQYIAANPHLPGMIPTTDPAEPIATSSENVKIYHNYNPETDARFMLVTHAPSNGRTNDAFSFSVSLPDGDYTIPQAGTLELNGFDAKWLSAGIEVGSQRLVYSTSEFQTAATIGDQEIALFYGRTGEDGETVLRFNAEPSVEILQGEAETVFDAASGDLRLNYAHNDPIRMRITADGNPPMLLLIGDEAEAYRWWSTQTEAGTVLSRGPDIVRSAAISGDILSLQGDTVEETPLEVFAPDTVTSITWNGSVVDTTETEYGSVTAVNDLAGPDDVTLPELAWTRMAGSPETDPAFDDSDWQKTEGQPTRALPRPPGGAGPNLFMDSYGFHHGDVWYRGRFEGSEAAETIQIHYGAGGAGVMQAYLDGELIGQDETPAGLPRPIGMGVVEFEMPAKAREPGEHVLSILVRNNGHNWDLEADDYHKEGRGLFHVDISKRTGPNFAVPINWKIQGNLGGEDIPDKVRGVVNNGGLYGERVGWHLPGHDASDWKEVSLPETEARPGVTWYRSDVALDLPEDQDVSVALAFGDTSTPRSVKAYRALIFVNGWNLGQFISHVGPQRQFILPEGILNHNGDNTIALAVTSDGAEGNTLEDVRLEVMRNVKGGIDVSTLAGPNSIDDLIQSR